MLVEALEDRKLLSAYTLSGGILTINGSSGADQIAASYIAGKVAVTVAAPGKAPWGKSFSAGSFTKLVIKAGAGADRVQLMFVNYTKPSVVYGSDGNDTILSGTGKDTLYGGAGADYLSGGPNVDRLEGGSGNDSLLGGEGNDILIGGTGRDTLKGEGGNDRLYARDGVSGELLIGGYGTDSAQVDSGDKFDSPRTVETLLA
jgi:Ca2+-binding RTX toxin-like protein